MAWICLFLPLDSATWTWTTVPSDSSGKNFVDRFLCFLYWPASNHTHYIAQNYHFNHGRPESVGQGEQDLRKFNIIIIVRKRLSTHYYQSKK